MKNTIVCTATVCALSLFINSTPAHAHGFEGDRFFPPTPLTDDPFATDELALPTIQYNPASASRELDVSASFTKEIFPKFAFSVAGTYVNLNPKNDHAQDGFSNVDLSVKYQLWEVPEHEFILSLGSDIELGGTGSKGLGVNNYTTYTPTLYFGKGCNELPEALKYLKPFAFTGVVGYDLYSDAPDSNAIEWGGSLQYSIPYLQEHVEDVGLPRPFRDLIPLVEFQMTSPTNRSGQTTTGTINPGVLWEGKYCQVGLEASIPVNSHSGPAVGGLFQVQIFIDDLFPKVFGHPLFFGDDK